MTARAGLRLGAARATTVTIPGQFRSPRRRAVTILAPQPDVKGGHR
jgi:hypothetical protein